MDTTTRGALLFVRFIAVCAMGMSALEWILDWAEFRFRQIPVNYFAVAFGAVLFFTGLIIMIKARAVADWIADKLE